MRASGFYTDTNLQRSIPFGSSVIALGYYLVVDPCIYHYEILCLRLEVRRSAMIFHYSYSFCQDLDHLFKTMCSFIQE